MREWIAWVQMFQTQLFQDQVDSRSSVCFLSGVSIVDTRCHYRSSLFDTLFTLVHLRNHVANRPPASRLINTHTLSGLPCVMSSIFDITTYFLSIVLIPLPRQPSKGNS
ncbi:uncharacterized protein LOC123988076 [Osmia bicornis bicornis]|uniref:uncharacterized protein LOC123988076 n=1 Tax=Osmia bicornis bicornis TaxID=1437191 RepID=UPI001EAEFBD6|nr:uncharacterized protein LOC123988076 [Osmia bicornis bicornis]